MAETMTVGQDLEGWVLDAVRKSNTVTIEALKVLTDAVQPVMAAVPTVTPPLVYDFAEKLMTSERKFAEDVLHLTTRLVPASAK